jgi:cation transporter-like permease
MATQSDNLRHHPVTVRASVWLWLAPMLAMVLVGLYSVLRYNGNWAENDSAVFTQTLRVFTDSGQLVPDNGLVYPNGFAFQSISTVILALTGLEIQDLQQHIYPLLALVVVVPAWVTYRTLTDSNRGATLAVGLLLTQPEFLFVILRSSHEKFTRTLMLLCIFLLVRSATMHKKTAPFAIHVVLFYLMAFALIASNNLLGQSFIFSLSIAMGMSWLLQRRTAYQTVRDLANKRLLQVTITGMALVYLATFYIYPPAKHDVLILEDTWLRVEALVFAEQGQPNEVPPTPTDPYTYVTATWPSLPVYFMVSIANWILLLVSFVLWTGQGWRWIVQNQPPRTQARQLLWLFYLALGVEGAMSILVDFSGALGSNLQQRIFPSFSMIAVAIVATAVTQWRPKFGIALLNRGLVAIIVILGVLAVIKATNEPFLSNKWVFYRDNEITAMRWADDHLRQSQIWTEFDERLFTAYITNHGPSQNRNAFVRQKVKETTRVFLISDITRSRSSRLETPLPTPPDALRIYDNGEAELYRLRPQTPNQR